MFDVFGRAVPPGYTVKKIGEVASTAVTFAPPTTTRATCPEPTNSVEQIVLSVVDGRSDYLRYDGAVLVLVKDGAGLVFQIT